MQKYMFLVALVVDALAKNGLEIYMATGGLKRLLRWANWQGPIEYIHVTEYINIGRELSREKKILSRTPCLTFANFRPIGT